jgi:hypothetical protein
VADDFYGQSMILIFLRDRQCIHATNLPHCVVPNTLTAPQRAIRR